MIGIPGINNAAEFNRRAHIALRGVKTTSSFLKNMIGLIANGNELTPAQQTAFYSAVHGHRRQISDQLVLDYAAGKAKGADL